MSPESAPRTLRLAPYREPLVLLQLVAALVACGFLLWPFLVPLTGVGLIALLTAAPFRSLLRKVRSRSAAAAIAVICVTLSIVVPAAVAIQYLAQRILAALTLLRTPAAVQRLQESLAAVRLFAARHSIPLGGVDLQSAVDNVSGPIGGVIVSLLGGSITGLTNVVLMLFLLFFWYRSGDHFIDTARRLLPFSRSQGRFLSSVVIRTVRAVLLGRFAVAGVQAVLAWITFLALGVPGASLLGPVTFVCCVLPAVGAFFVWVPVAVYLVLIHAWTKAVILALVGTFVLSTIDNVLQAVISGTQAKMGTVEMFLSILGGVWLLGMSGIVLGPVIWVLTGALLLIWNKRPTQSAAVSAP